MRLVVQRVSRATVEVDGYVESRIGSGLVLSLGLRVGDTREQAVRLAARVVKLKLWPEAEKFEPSDEKLWSTSVIDNGFEVLVLFQKSLCFSFGPQPIPTQQSALQEKEAKGIFEAFVAQLRKEYQEEMVVAGPMDTANMRVEATQDGPGMFELEASSPAIAPKEKLAAATAELLPEVASVSSALQRLVDSPHRAAGSALATLEACRIYRVFAMKKFRDALAAAEQSEADALSETLEAAAGLFSRKQQEQITAWTGLAITTPPAEEHEAEDELPHKPEVKEEQYQANPPSRRRPDLAGRAAPNTPAGARVQQGRYGGKPQQQQQPQSWGLTSYRAGAGYSGGKGKKGGGKAKGMRSYGIASLDESVRLHGGARGGYEHGQLSALPDANVKVGRVKEEGDDDAKRRGSALGGVLKRPKGTPTVAPLCPAQGEDEEDVWEDL